MHLYLETKKYCEFFWLRYIRDVDISECCAKCFIADTDKKVYWETKAKHHAVINVQIRAKPQYRAYYLCGLAKGFKWADNTHVAFVPDENSNILIENDKIKLQISGARQIMFEGYKPNPPGHYTPQQRSCRNWIFANYLKDGMPL